MRFFSMSNLRLLLEYIRYPVLIASLSSVVWIVILVYQGQAGSASIKLLQGLLGALACGLLAKFLKVLLRVPRPHSTQTPTPKQREHVFDWVFPSSRLYAMPSSHSQVMFYFSAFFTRWYPNWYFTLVVWSMAFAVALSRIVLGKHTAFQTLVGGCIGISVLLLLGLSLSLTHSNHTQILVLMTSQGTPIFTAPPSQPSMHRSASPTQPQRSVEHRIHIQESNVPSKPKPVVSNGSPTLERKESLISQTAEELPRQYNTGPELEHLVSNLGVKKSKNSLDKSLFLGFLAGMFVFFAGIFSLSLAGGIPKEIRTQWPVLPKSILALTFPVGLVFIMLFGGDLFTGNTMIMTVAFLNRKVTFKELAINWTLAFVSNFASILFLSYVFAYVPGLFQSEPHLSYIVGLAERKANLPPLHMFLLGIPANALVCLAIFLGLAARDVTGKVFGLFLPIITFAASGWEHCVANMLFLSLGAFYGANITVGAICMNVFLVALGNIVGGGIIVGGSEYYLYHWHSDSAKQDGRTARSNKIEPLGHTRIKWFKGAWNK